MGKDWRIGIIYCRVAVVWVGKAESEGAPNQPMGGVLIYSGEKSVRSSFGDDRRKKSRRSWHLHILEM